MNYNPSTIARIGDIKQGIGVTTSVLANASYLTGGTQTELFTVKGLVSIEALFMEFTVACSANATQVLFNTTFTTPVIAVNAMCAKCASISALPAGGRIVWLGGAVATNAVITDSAGLSVGAAVIPQMVGGKDFVGSIGCLDSDANQASGNFFVHLRYVPILEGSYVEAKL